MWTSSARSPSTARRPAPPPAPPLAHSLRDPPRSSAHSAHRGLRALGSRAHVVRVLLAVPHLDVDARGGALLAGAAKVGVHVVVGVEDVVPLLAALLARLLLRLEELVLGEDQVVGMAAWRPTSRITLESAAALAPHRVQRASDVARVDKRPRAARRGLEENVVEVHPRRASKVREYRLSERAACLHPRAARAADELDDVR